MVSCESDHFCYLDFAMERCSKNEIPSLMFLLLPCTENTWPTQVLTFATQLTPVWSVMPDTAMLVP